MFVHLPFLRHKRWKVQRACGNGLIDAQIGLRDERGTDAARIFHSTTERERVPQVIGSLVEFAQRLPHRPQRHIAPALMLAIIDLL